LKSSQEDIELLEAYLKGRLNTDDMSALETRLKNEPDLNADYNDLKVLVEGMRASVLENKLQMLKSLENKETPVSPNVNKKRPASFLSTKRIWLAGIIIVLITLFGWWIMHEKVSTVSEKSKQLFAERFDRELILHRTERSAGGNDSLTLKQKIAYDLYAIQEFEEAIPKLNELWKIQHDTTAYFYLGVCYLATGNTSEGNKILSDPAIMTNRNFKQKAASILSDTQK